MSEILDFVLNSIEDEMPEELALKVIARYLGMEYHGDKLLGAPIFLDKTMPENTVDFIDHGVRKRFTWR